MSTQQRAGTSRRRASWPSMVRDSRASIREEAEHPAESTTSEAKLQLRKLSS